MQRLKTLLTLSFLSVSLLQATTPHIFSDLETQFQALQEYNKRCIELNQHDRRIYFFVYQPGQSIDFEEVSSGYDWFNYYLLPASGEGLFDGHSLTYLNDRLKDFNQIGEESLPAQTEPVEVYAFFINDFKGYINAKPDQLVNNEQESVLAYLAQEKGSVGPQAFDDYKTYKEALKERVSNFNFGPGENKLLIYGSGFKAYQWKGKYERIYSIHASAKGALLENSVACRKAYQEAQFKHRQFPFHFPTSSVAAQHFANAVLSQLEFLSSSELLTTCEACGPTVAEYLTKLWDPTAKEFLRQRCAQFKDNPERLGYAYSIAQFIQSLGTIYYDFETQQLPPDEYNWSGVWEEYLSYEQALRNHETEIITAHDRLKEAIESEDWYQVFLTLYHFERPIYFEQLSVQDRLKALEVLATGPMLGNWLLGNHEKLVLSLLDQVPSEPLYVEQLLGGLRQSPGLLERLFYKINNHWVGEASRFKFISSIYRLILKRPVANQNNTSYTMIWDLPDQYVLNSFDYDVQFTEAGTLNFTFQQCAEVDNYYTGNNFTDDRGTFCIRKSESQWLDVDPFALLDIAVVDRITVIDICGQGGCKGKLFKKVPAVLAAYLIEQTALEDRIDLIMNSLEVVGLSIGVGELALALRLQSRVRLLIAGYLLGSDISSIAITSEVFKAYLLERLGEEEGNKLYEHLLFFNTLNGLLAGTLSLWAVDDAAKAVAATEKLKQMNISIEGIEEQLGFSLGTLSGTELKQLSQAIKRELSSTEEGRNALRTAKAALGLDEIAEIINQLQNAGASEELINKIISMPLDDSKLLLSQLLRNNNRIIPKFNSTIELVDIWQKYRSGETWEGLLNWDETLFYRHFSDLDMLRFLRGLFQDYPRMTRAYAVLSGDGTFDYLPYRTNLEDLKMIDEYLQVYPGRLAQLEADLRAATDKKGFIKQLLWPGKPGTKIWHRVRGLWESINLRYQPSDAHLSEFELAPNLILTEVHPPQGGKAGHYKRYWDSSTNTFVLDEGFRYDAPKWIKDVPIPLVEGKGIPTSTYVTLRQMKYLQIPEGSLQNLKLSLVQNAEIMRDIYFIMQENNLLNLQEVGDYLLNKSGIQYATTMIKQAGYDISKVNVLDQAYTHYLTTREIRDKKNVVEITDQWLQQNNLTWNSKFYVHFDVVLELTPIP